LFQIRIIWVYIPNTYQESGGRRLHMDRFRWVLYNGKSVLYQDFSNLRKDELVSILEQSHKRIAEKGETDIIVVTNINSINFDRNTTKVFEEVSGKNKAFVRKSALYGVGTWQRVAIEAVGKLTGREFAIFKTSEEIDRWLNELK